MVKLLNRSRLLELFRYYQAGIVNMLFGFGLYALLVWIGLDIYIAQLLAHLVGMAFNYFTYSHHVFSGSRPAKFRFILSYTATYLLSLGVLAAVAQFVVSPYLAGIITAVVVSAINYFALKLLVFRASVA